MQMLFSHNGLKFKPLFTVKVECTTCSKSQLTSIFYHILSHHNEHLFNMHAITIKHRSLTQCKHLQLLKSHICLFLCLGQRVQWVSGSQLQQSPQILTAYYNAIVFTVQS